MSEVVEQIYKYQPTDDEGRPIGGQQVIKYTTQEELIEKMRENSVLLIRKLRQETKKAKLGILDTEEIADTYQRFDGTVEFSPRDLTDEERYDISRRLLDPATSAEAASELVEARLGASLDVIGKTLQSVQQDSIGIRARLEAQAFHAENPEYYKCDENFESIAAYLIRYELAPVKANFQLAYDTLRSQGLLVEGAPEVVPQPATVVVPVEEILAPVVPATPVIPGVDSGFSRESSSDAGSIPLPGSDIVYKLPNGQILTGLAALKAMPGDEYKKRLLTDKEFGKKADKLEAEARTKR